MSDPLRTDHARPPDESGLADHEARIEQLLLAGLDHYFAAEYEQAIHVWTRVVFLDRSHDRARAYIERARQAVAERQRESEELVHRGVAAFERGQTETARQLLNDALARGGPHDIALAVLDRVNRADAGALADAAPAGAAVPYIGRLLAPRPARPEAHAGRRPGAWIALAAALCALAVGGLFWWQGPQAAWLASITRVAPALPVVSAVPVEPLPVPRTAETMLVRARTLYDAGRLQDALRALDSIPPSDTLRPDADRLRADVQRALLMPVPSTEAAASGTPPPDAAPGFPVAPAR